MGLTPAPAGYACETYWVKRAVLAGNPGIEPQPHTVTPKGAVRPSPATGATAHVLDVAVHEVPRSCPRNRRSASSHQSHPHNSDSCRRNSHHRRDATRTVQRAERIDHSVPGSTIGAFPCSMRNRCPAGRVKLSVVSAPSGQRTLTSAVQPVPSPKVNAMSCWAP